MSCKITKYGQFYELEICVNNTINVIQKEVVNRFWCRDKESCLDIIETYGIDRFAYHIATELRTGQEIDIYYADIDVEEGWWLSADLEIRQCKHCNEFYIIDSSCQCHQDYYCLDCNRNHFGRECIE